MTSIVTPRFMPDVQYSADPPEMTFKALVWFRDAARGDGSVAIQ